MLPSRLFSMLPGMYHACTQGGTGDRREGKGRAEKGQEWKAQLFGGFGRAFRTEGGAKVVAVHLIRVRREEKVAALDGTG